MFFEIVGELQQVEVICAGHETRELGRLRRIHGRGRWRKLKGIGVVRLPDGTIARAELHRYEAHGIGRRELKLKRLLW